jgi:hypothetical protein
VKPYIFTYLALVIALITYMIGGSWLRPKEFVTNLRLRLIELGHVFRKVRWHAGLKIIPLFMIGVVAVSSNLEAIHLRPDPAGPVMVEKEVFDAGGGYLYTELVPHAIVKDYGVISRKSVTTAGITLLANAFLNTFETELFNFHASGTGGTAENITDTLLVTEVETRVAGTQSNPSAGVYRTVATISYTATRTITEHGIFSVITTNTVSLLDRSLFTGIPVISGDSIQFTYNFTYTAGG